MIIERSVIKLWSWQLAPYLIRVWQELWKVVEGLMSHAAKNKILQHATS
jgi:hypothetical protein